jgi:hypothetical protein
MLINNPQITPDFDFSKCANNYHISNSYEKREFTRNSCTDVYGFIPERLAFAMNIPALGK